MDGLTRARHAFSVGVAPWLGTIACALLGLSDFLCCKCRCRLAYHPLTAVMILLDACCVHELNDSTRRLSCVYDGHWKRAFRVNTRVVFLCDGVSTVGRLSTSTRKLCVVCVYWLNRWLSVFYVHSLPLVYFCFDMDWRPVDIPLVTVKPVHIKTIMEPKLRLWCHWERCHPILLGTWFGTKDRLPQHLAILMAYCCLDTFDIRVNNVSTCGLLVCCT